MDGEKYTSVCKKLGWTAVAIISIFVILTFIFMIIGFVLGLLTVGSDSSRGGASNMLKKVYDHNHGVQV